MIQRTKKCTVYSVKSGQTITQLDDITHFAEKHGLWTVN